MPEPPPSSATVTMAVIFFVGLQAPQHGGQAVPAADGRDARLPAVGLIEPDLFGQFCHRAYLLPISRWLSVAA